MLARLTTDQMIPLAVAIAAAVAALVRVWIFVAHERRRTKPIVIAHEERGRHLSKAQESSWFAVDSYVMNEGAGAAFNVRFGVELQGVRYAFWMSSEDPRGGNVQRVIRQGERRPDGGGSQIRIDEATTSGAGDPDPTRVYWARYENSRGKTWETRNPADRSATLDIRRVRFVRRREWCEERAQRRAAKFEEAFWTTTLEELSRRR